ncbi:MAG: pantoate--beta-alanine ligase [Victivallales bacterium]|jgi:pantoate--beta-alanine ligase
MKILGKIKKMQAYSASLRKKGLSIAVVPTMGCLHEGHLKLIDTAKRHADAVIVTVFVNPAQFGPKEDFSRYPRPFRNDLILCKKHGADAIFAPSPDEMYSADFSTWIEELTLSKGLCGKSRPGHFKGVTTVVAKLFNATLPDFAVFGRKDFQQAKIIRRMVRDLNFPVKIVLEDIVREKDGLAKSSRNTYLSREERRCALSISRSLKSAKLAIANGEKRIGSVRKNIISEIEAGGGRIDYVEIVDPENLEPVKILSGKILIAVASFFGKTRLIDNIEIN